MKTKKLKTFLALMLALCCVSILFTATFTVKAEEVPEQTEITVETGETEDEKSLMEKSQELIAKATAYLNTTAGYFETKILPLIISATISALVAVVIKALTSKKAKQYKANYIECATAYKALKEKMESTENELKARAEENAALLAEIKSIVSTAEEQKASMLAISESVKVLSEDVSNLKDGAVQAWAECPDAVRAVTRTPDGEHNVE